MAHIALEISQRHSQSISGRADAVLHLTLCHLGKITWEQSQVIAGSLKRGARSLPASLVMRATDYLVFGPPEAPIMVRKVTCDSFDLESHRAGLVEALERNGLPVSRQYEPWVPHVSVGPKDASYASGDAPFTITRVGLFAAPMILHYSFYLGEGSGPAV